jgi:PKD repeat protein
MKKLLTLIVLSIMSLTAFAQNPCTATYAVSNQDTLYVFTPVSTNATGNLSYNWRIFDTITNTMLYAGNATNPMVVIPKGEYAMVTLWITDANGCVASSGYSPVGLNSTSTFSPCNASFYLFPDTANPQTYYGYNISTGTNLQYMWSWGDGTSSNTQYPSHTYANAGWYTICLVVINPTNCLDSMCIPYYVYRGNNGSGIHSITIIDNSVNGIKNLDNFYNTPKKKVVKIIDEMGRESQPEPNKVLIYLYNDGTVEKKYIKE